MRRIPVTTLLVAVSVPVFATACADALTGPWALSFGTLPGAGHARRAGTLLGEAPRVWGDGSGEEGSVSGPFRPRR